MKHLIKQSTFLLVIIFLLAGCDALRTVRGTGDITTETREVSNFSAVNLGGIGTVVIEFGDKESLTIEAEDNLLPYLESEVDGGTLNLGMRQGVNVVPTQAIFYHLTVRSLEEIGVSGLGNIDLPRVEDTQLAIRVSGGGNIDIEELQAKNLDVRISGLGDINIDGGSVAEQDIDISGGGNYNARELASEVTNVSISGLGNANVWANDTLDANISGGGSVRYAGRPQVTQNVSGVGDVGPLGE